MVHHSPVLHYENPFKGNMAAASTDKKSASSTVANLFMGFELDADIYIEITITLRIVCDINIYRSLSIYLYILYEYFSFRFTEISIL